MSYGKIPAQFHAAYDAHMAQAPVSYRGFLIVPASYAHDPYYVAGFGKSQHFYWGHTLCDDKGSNVAPGATAFFTIEQVKHVIDCIHLAGGFNNENRREWIKEFWDLMGSKSRFDKLVNPRYSVLPEDALESAWWDTMKDEPAEPAV